MKTLFVTIKNNSGEHTGMLADGEYPSTGDWVEIEIPSGNDPFSAEILAGEIVRVYA